jgi:hypothetical protein
MAKSSQLTTVILVGLLLLAGWLSWRPTKTKLSNQYFSGDINELWIGKAHLKINNGQWRVVGANWEKPADTDKVDTLVKQLKLVSLDDLVAENQNKFEELGFDDRSVEVKVNNRFLKVGKLGPGEDSTLVLAENKIYRLRIVWNQELWQDENYWINRRVTSIPFFQIKSIEIKQGKKLTTLKQNEGKWEKEKLVATMANLESLGPIEKKIETTNSVTELVINEESKTTNLRVGRAKDEDKKSFYWAAVNDKDVYEISKNDYETLTKM